jgi:tRNA pseudouridine synthase 2
MYCTCCFLCTARSASRALQGKIRLDAYLAAQLPDASRAKISASIKAGLININGAAVAKPSYTVKSGDSITAALLPPEPCTVS